MRYPGIPRWGISIAEKRGQLWGAVDVLQVPGSTALECDTDAGVGILSWVLIRHPALVKDG